MPDSDSITSREMAEYLENKRELSERDREYLALDAKKNQATAAPEGANINAYTNWATNMNNNTLSTTNANANAANNTAINANNADDDDDRRSVLSSRIMRSGLTNIGQLVRKAPGLQSAQDRQTVEAAMRDPRYLDSWRGTKMVQLQQLQQQQSQPQQRQPQGFQYQPRPSVPLAEPHQPQAPPQPEHDAASVLQQYQDHQHQHQQLPLPLYAPFISLQEIDAELDRVPQEQKGHLFEAVDCEVRVKVLHWHRHAMMEREANANTAKNNKE
ncbi:hypothetical protein COL154_009315 [Colletotrichum chrysophilum]|uniref:uncharacterized protein n=1 Tax=Colletotrichum chrysophilum TaxID=1836956 RepID=UPI0022FFED45|nr:uncharacterized protein COL26b_011054 [Colletotrichum chrysophilum]KAJ0358251.1 hypothetical protein COL154_009315 [Colletotrichum chrysophilum]KAJ0367935.1 hypothetical protein COL26b_011054 [Colletotrichum chrysophilum]